MAAKTYFITFLLILSSWNTSAQSDEQELKEWTLKNETKLLEKYSIVQSEWFVEECLKLANSMQLTDINTCQLFQSDEINAYVFNNGHVYFSTALLKLINNEHQLASILAHEYAHIELTHYIKTLKKIKKPGIFFPKKRVNKLLKKHEQEADDWSEKNLQLFGYDTDQINYFLRRVSQTTKQSKSNRHIKITKRIKKVTLEEILDSTYLKMIKDLINRLKPED
jgi:hypothetical protein